MDKKSEFYTLNGYILKDGSDLTIAMEDYLEMMYRIHKSDKRIRINFLAGLLNVKPSSVSKMVDKLIVKGFVYKNDKDVILTDKGINRGKYLLWRHDTLVKFFRLLNKDDYCLEQVEKIEHFIDDVTLVNMDKFIG